MINLIVLVTFVRFKQKILARKNRRILFSMALADFFIGLFTFSLGICIATRPKWRVYRLVANIPLFGSMFVSILSMAMLTADRLVAVKVPLRYASVVTSKRLEILITASWVLPIILTIQQYLILGLWYRYELKVRGLLLLVFIAAGSVFLAIANSYLYAAVKKQWVWNKQNRPPGNDDENNQDSHPVVEGCAEDEPRKTWRCLLHCAKVKKNDLRVSKECVVIIFVFICCWSPLTIYRVYHSLVTPPHIPVLRRLFLIMASFTSIINPYIYFFRKKQFKKYLVLRRQNVLESTSIGQL